MRKHFQLDLLNPGHENCRHMDYLLGCNEYEVLLDRAHGLCEICEIPGFRNARRKLFIDHDSRIGRWAVRGLLCQNCNFDVQRLTGPEFDRYLARPFYLDVLRVHQAPLFLEEPPIGSRVADSKGETWTHGKKEWSRPPSSYSRCSCCHDWRYLHYQNGPHVLGRHLRLPQ